VTVEEAIRGRIEDLTAVTAIVGARIYLDKTPQDPTYPLVLVYLAGDHRDQHLRGPHGLAHARVSVEARAHEDSGVDTYEVTALFAAIDGDGLGPAASGVFGWAGSVGSPALAILNCEHRGSRDRFYDAAEQRVLRMTQDYWVSYCVP
jgi:hypothetical protein